MVNVYVIGAGMVGSAMALDLSNDYHVHLTDNNLENLSSIKKRNPSITITQLDVTDHKTLLKWLKPADIVLMGVPGHLGYQTLKAVIGAGKNIVDISFSPENVLELSPLAENIGVSVIVDSGVAPGIPNFLLGYHNTKMEIKSFEYYVGGLPKNPEPPYNYKAPFSPIDVIEEYTRPARMMIDGEIVIKPALSEIEIIDIQDAGKLEAFNTDGLRSILMTMNHIPNMKEKTLRYPGHAKIMKSYRDAGKFNSGQIENKTAHLFEVWKLEKYEPEFTVLDVLIRDKHQTISYHLYDEFDINTGITSMSRTTGYTATASINLIIKGYFSDKGVFPPELIGGKKGCMDFILNYLNDRKVRIQKL
ncbi:MAG: saccharopine dehydrogenase C-terminal domain-containing protein [Candidatus Marinimicrobia bacterium]|jgi:saccharopine dehydrogenase-like NADP-dependent oxidoreductase|nr:saccharopine dehydrogenase C-terminal domain-containing protein [Candidatus Neomarinimicrobiota bacterium]MDP6726755.1 saccharopine dehydrogenase C-terminal domain-containing protein [Candidatus Neomarinimicrobiota bacterium]|tara:strand:- start:2057 stop:3139 length:1083 start_codon:yes stop_codon:yes gene_type:complete